MIVEEFIPTHNELIELGFSVTEHEGILPDEKYNFYSKELVNIRINYDDSCKQWYIEPIKGAWNPTRIHPIGINEIEAYIG